MDKDIKNIILIDLFNVWHKAMHVCNYDNIYLLSYMINYIKFIYKSKQYDEIYLVIDGKDKSTKSSYAKYKEGRNKREGCYDTLRTFVSVVSRYVTVVRNKDAEGDFVLAKLAMHFLNKNYDVTIFSNDKDFLQLAQFNIHIADKLLHGKAIILTEEEILMKFKNSKKEPLDKLQNILKYRVFKGDTSDRISPSVKGLQDKYIREIINLWEGNDLNEDILNSLIDKIKDKKIQQQLINNKKNILRNYKLMNLINVKDEVLENIKILTPKIIEGELKKWKVSMNQIIWI